MYPNRLLFCLTLAAATLLAGCNRRTPEERLAKAQEFISQNDLLSAEMEAKKVVEKNPDDPAAIQARVLLAQIYSHDQRFDEARAELEPALDKVSQKDALGQGVLKTYLGILQREKKFDDAFKTIDKFQEKYANDEGTSLNLTVARADIQTVAGQTTAARETLVRLHDTTTSPAEIELYRTMIASTYSRDRDTTGVIGFFEKELANAKEPEERRNLTMQLSGLYAATDNYEKVREYATQATQAYDEMAAAGADIPRQQAAVIDLGRLYIDIGNLDGARRAFQAVFDSGLQDPRAIMMTAAGLVEALVRQGEPDAAIGFLKEAAGRFPTAPFGQQSAQVESMKKEGRLANMVDTSTLAMRFKTGEPLAPKNLPKPVETTGTLSAAMAQTTSTAAATTETQSSTGATSEPTAAAATTTDTASTSPTI